MHSWARYRQLKGESGSNGEKFIQIYFEEESIVNRWVCRKKKKVGPLKGLSLAFIEPHNPFAFFIYFDRALDIGFTPHTQARSSPHPNPSNHGLCLQPCSLSDFQDGKLQAEWCVAAFLSKCWAPDGPLIGFGSDNFITMPKRPVPSRRVWRQRRLVPICAVK